MVKLHLYCLGRVSIGEWENFLFLSCKHNWHLRPFLLATDSPQAYCEKEDEDFGNIHYRSGVHKQGLEKFTFCRPTAVWIAAGLFLDIIGQIFSCSAASEPQK